MDESRFDAITKAAAVSRRGALKLAFAGSITGLTAMVGAHDSRAARRGFSGPINPFESSGCTIGGTTHAANTIEPGNPCHICDPGLDRNDWSPNFGAFCGDGGQVCCNGECCPATHCCSLDETCTPCRCDIDGELHPAGTPHPTSDCLICDPAQNLTGWSPIGDGSECGGVPGRVCCNGECCSPTECCEGVGVCTECGPHCHIGGVDIDAGTVNPQDECAICDPERSLDDWSPIDDGRACNGGDGCCVAGECGTCSCEIDDEPVLNGTRNPRNDCEACRYRINPSDWTNLDNGAACGNDIGRGCCAGECCQSDECCTLDGCESCCRIGSDHVADGVVNRTNTCQICDASRDSGDWTTLGDGEICGATGNSECCDGACCPSGQCCRNGACGECGCEIDGRTIDPGTVNGNNPCEICTPALDRFDWSGVATGTSCDSDGGTCCGRDCCSSDKCCLLEACGECLCSIENEIFEPREPNPLVECQLCDPAADPFAWSTAPDQTACGDGSQVCCAGDCCDAGLCCLDGACQACGCLIEGVPVDDGALDPVNPCQRCDASLDPLAWTPLDDGASCGDSGAQCCEGGQCNFCSCLIEGAVISDGDVNPENACEHCDVALDPGAWSPRNETFACGNGNQFCCNGVCCEEGLCCGLNDICEACGCLIDGVSYVDGTPNPRNRCEVCMAAFPNAWSPRTFPDCPTPCLIDGQIYHFGTINPVNACEMCRGGEEWSPSTALVCGDGSQNCCNGICCEPGACCTAEGVCGFDACEPEGCVIDGMQFADGVSNPVNACEVCQIATSTTSWTPQLGPCGANGDQFCCAGVCCELGACCSPDQVCDFDICQTCAIDGVLWFPEDLNPANTCQWCISNANKFGWTTKPDNFFCDELQLTVCCNGSCCNAGESCSQGSCLPL